MKIKITEKPFLDFKFITKLREKIIDIDSADELQDKLNKLGYLDYSYYELSIADIDDFLPHYYPNCIGSLSYPSWDLEEIIEFRNNYKEIEEENENSHDCDAYVVYCNLKNEIVSVEEFNEVYIGDDEAISNITEEEIEEIELSYTNMNEDLIKSCIDRHKYGEYVEQRYQHIEGFYFNL